jgi:Ca2+-binding RTX toxin-like protein
MLSSRCRIALSVAAAVAIAGLPAAWSQAATVTRANGVVRVQADAGDADVLFVRECVAAPFQPPCTRSSVLLSAPSSPLGAGAGSDCDEFTDLGTATVRCPRGDSRLEAVLLDQGDHFEPLGRLTFRLVVDAGGGDDTVEGEQGADELEGGPGDDLLVGWEGDDRIEGGAGDDRLQAGAGTDVLDGGADDDEFDRFISDPLRDGAGDTLTGGDGDDRFHDLATHVIGGPGRDVVNLAAISGDAVVSLDDQPNDSLGALTGANVHSDVEEVLAGTGADDLTGSAGPDRLDGGDGPDRIAGAAGTDVLVGGSGDDQLVARDGAPDQIDCGPGRDVAHLDAADSAAGCEVILLDADGDGAETDIDCNDANAGIRPGAVDRPDDGVDQDCSGADLVDLDRDRDGFARPGDCDDADPAIHPGAREKPGNAEDENCNGEAEPFPRITSEVRNRWAAGARTRVLLLTVRDPPPGSVVRLGCRGRGCPAKKRIRATGGREIRLARFFTRALSPGAVVVIRITSRGWTGKFVRYTIRRGRLPAVKVLCLPQGRNRPDRCATARGSE